MNSRGVHASLARAAWSRWSLTNQHAPEHLDSGPTAAIAVCAQMHVSICMRSVREQDETRSMFRSRRLARPVAGLRAVQRQLMAGQPASATSACLPGHCSSPAQAACGCVFVPSPDCVYTYMCTIEIVVYYFDDGAARRPPDASCPSMFLPCFQRRCHLVPPRWLSAFLASFSFPCLRLRGGCEESSAICRPWDIRVFPPGLPCRPAHGVTASGGRSAQATILLWSGRVICIYMRTLTYIRTHTHVRVGSGAVEGGSELHFSSCPWRSVLLVLVSMYTGKRAILPNLTESIGETQRCGLKHVQLPTCRPRLCIKLQANTHGPVGEQSEIDMQCSLVPVPAAGSWKPSLVGPGISDMKQYVYVRSVASCLLRSPTMTATAPCHLDRNQVFQFTTCGPR